LRHAALAFFGSLFLFRFFKPSFRFGHRPAFLFCEKVTLHLSANGTFASFKISFGTAYNGFDSFRGANFNGSHRVLIVLIWVFVTTADVIASFFPRQFFSPPITDSLIFSVVGRLIRAKKTSTLNMSLSFCGIYCIVVVAQQSQILKNSASYLSTE
jgi:hypothetical protein